MELKEIKELFKVFDESGSSYFALEQDGVKIKLKKPSEMEISLPKAEVTNQVKEVKPETPQEPEDGTKVLAPLVGVFYAAPTPEASAYVQVGDKVKEGQILCLIEAMKMMSEITAPKDGIIKKIYVKNQDVVGFEDPLFLIGD